MIVCLLKTTNSGSTRIKSAQKKGPDQAIIDTVSGNPGSRGCHFAF